MSKQQLLVRVELEHDLRMKVLVPWQQKDWIQKIRSLPNRAWNKEQKYWSVPKDEPTLNRLKELFGKALIVSINISFNDAPPKLEVAKNLAKFPPNLVMASAEHLAKAKLAYQQSQTNSFPQSIKELPAQYFKAIQKGCRVNKVFVGEKVIIQYANEAWLSVWVPYEKYGWIDIVKSINGRKWRPEEKCWIIPYVKDALERLSQIDAGNLNFNFEVANNIPSVYEMPSRPKQRLSKKKELTAIQKRAVTAFEDRLLIERCSWRTIKSYRIHLVGLLLAYPKEKPSLIKADQVQAYILKQIKTKNISESTQNQLVNALKAFYERVCKQTDKVKSFIRPKKKPKKLPNILSKKEVESLLNCIQNLKHKAMIALIYSAGLRKGELINLRKKDIIFSRKCIFVKNGKGKKDRFVMLSPKIENMLHQYIKIHSPRYWLFEGQTRGQYSESSLQNIFTRAKEKSRVNPYITIHGLRHSFATHLHEAGVPLHAIKDLLGHNSIKTTEIYLHLSNKFSQQIKSPLDFLQLN